MRIVYEYSHPGGLEILKVRYLSYGEQLVYDIERLKRRFPAVPVKIIPLTYNREHGDWAKQQIILEISGRFQ